ncbi:MAG: prepilin-type N-terminal cleavage/methylation domain-containing protein [Pirellulaceae bacterium]|jgi:prepilin-type N-terminal cleavage/methylation domain-containing protein|nr:prepilin-type N-terminal cleavage/methylation domain-containing protein [Pirellulaceae bacterium]
MKSPQRGFTLVELLAVLAVFSVVLGTAVMTLQALLQSGAHARDSMDASIQLTRFTTQLRADTHSALAVTAAADEHAGSPVVLRVQLPQEQLVEYRIQPDGIGRVARSGGSEDRSEFYRLSPQVERGWQVVPAGASSLVSVELRAGRDGGARDRRAATPLRVDAAVGLLTQAHRSSSNHVAP